MIRLIITICLILINGVLHAGYKVYYPATFDMVKLLPPGSHFFASDYDPSVGVVVVLPNDLDILPKVEEVVGEVKLSRSYAEEIKSEGTTNDKGEIKTESEINADKAIAVEATIK